MPIWQPTDVRVAASGCQISVRMLFMQQNTYLQTYPDAMWTSCGCLIDTRMCIRPKRMAMYRTQQYS